MRHRRDPPSVPRSVTIAFTAAVVIAGCYGHAVVTRTGTTNRGTTYAVYGDKYRDDRTGLECGELSGGTRPLAGDHALGTVLVVVARVEGEDATRASWTLIVEEPDGVRWSRTICTADEAGGRAIVKEHDIRLEKRGRYLFGMSCVGTVFRAYDIHVS